MSIHELYNIYLQHPSVQTDTRKLQPGDIFFALRGPNFNGNAFAAKALQAGAAYAVIDEEAYMIEGKTILVHDVLTALQQLAHHHRSQFHIPFIGITGSNGKTTTKELIHAVLSTVYKVYTTEGNLNNHIGVPLTILKIKNDAQVAVIEMGANHLHEIESYCAIARPTHGLITNCGKAHLEGFGSVEGVRKGKGELFDFLRAQKDGVAFIMQDYDYLEAMSKGIQKVVTYGTADAQISGQIVNSSTFLNVAIHVGEEKAAINTQLVGNYNLPNVLAAVAVGMEMNVPLQQIKTAIENYAPSNIRSQLITKGSNKYILDAYNANPSSMKLAIENFAAMDAPHKVLMLGAMAEMGDETRAEHAILIELIDKYNWMHVILVGRAFEEYASTYNYYNNVADAAAWFAKQHFENTAFLIKGSRSTQMEKIVTEAGII